MFKTTAIDTLKQDKKCQPCWYIFLSTMSGSTTTNLYTDSRTKHNGAVTVYDKAGKEKLRIDTASSSIISDQDVSGKTFLDISDTGSPTTGEGGLSRLFLGADNGKAGQMVLLDNTGYYSIELNGLDRRIHLRDNAGKDSIVLNGSNNSMVLKDKSGRDSMLFDGDIVLHDQDGRHSFGIHGKGRGGDHTGLWIGASTSDAGGPKAGYVAIREAAGNNSIVLGDLAEISLNNPLGKSITLGASGEISLATRHRRKRLGKQKSR